MSFQSLKNEIVFLIDYLDIVSANKFKLLNPDSVDDENFKFNMLLQFELSTVNGFAIISDDSKELEKGAFKNEQNEIITRSKYPIANIFI